MAVGGRYTDGRADPKTRTAGSKRLGLFVTPGALEADPITVTEAPVDALSVALCGVPAVALDGTAAPAWLAAACAFRRVVMALDADDRGDAAAVEIGAELTALGATVERWRPAGAKDWNALLVQNGAETLGSNLRGSDRDRHILDEPRRCTERRYTRVT